MNQVVLGDKGVIGGVERDEPVPLRIQPEQRGGCSERGGEAGGSHRGSRGGSANDIDVAERADGGGGVRDGRGQLVALGLRRIRREVEQVPVPGVVDGEEQPKELPPLPATPGEQVRERGRRGSSAAE